MRCGRGRAAPCTEVVLTAVAQRVSDQLLTMEAWFSPGEVLVGNVTLGQFSHARYHPSVAAMLRWAKGLSPTAMRIKVQLGLPHHV